MHMHYNIHPLFVHFPIALLFIYSLVQILPLQRWIPSTPWRSVGNVLLIAGFLGALAAASTGDIAAQLSQPNHVILELHELFASAVQGLYGILIGSLVVKAIISQWNKLRQYRVVSILLSITDFVDRRWVTIMVSVLGLLALVITGIFGGAMVYGATADPLATPLLHLFGVKI